MGIPMRYKPLLSIIWHSRTGAAQAIAKAMKRAAVEFEVDVRSISADKAKPRDLLIPGGLIFCAPEYLGSLSGVMKDFFDRSYYGAIDKCNGKPYALVISAGSDGTGAARQLARIATGLRLRPVAEPLIVITRTQTTQQILAPKVLSPEQLAPAIDLAAGFAAGLAAGIY